MAASSTGNVATSLENMRRPGRPGRIGVEFALEPDDPDAIGKRMRRAWINRKAEQPLSHQAAARVRNPHGQSAAQLLERAGLVRARVGAAEVSDRNANYIVAQPGPRRRTW